MKKIITFLFCTAVISSSFAQTGHRNRNKRSTNSDHYINSTQYNDVYHQNIIDQRDQEIKKVNDQNDRQVQQAVNNCNLNIWEKRDVLNSLEAQRIQKINDIYFRYSNTSAYYNANDGNNFYHHHKYDDER